MCLVTLSIMAGDFMDIMEFVDARDILDDEKTVQN